jgi:hypothetical protein
MAKQHLKLVKEIQIRDFDTNGSWYVNGPTAQGCIFPAAAMCLTCKP